MTVLTTKALSHICYLLSNVQKRVIAWVMVRNKNESVFEISWIDKWYNFGNIRYEIPVRDSSMDVK